MGCMADALHVSMQYVICMRGRARPVTHHACARCVQAGALPMRPCHTPSSAQQHSAAFRMLHSRGGGRMSKGAGGRRSMHACMHDSPLLGRQAVQLNGLLRRLVEVVLCAVGRRLRGTFPTTGS